MTGWSQIIPLAVIALVIMLRMRGAGRRRPLRLERLWIVPALYLLLVVVLFAEAPPPHRRLAERRLRAAGGRFPRLAARQADAHPRRPGNA
jgi:hypothetical protein